MAKRARYIGPHESVNVFDPEADVYAAPIDTVVRHGLLSADAPARVRDSLTAGADWNEIDQAPTKSQTRKSSGDKQPAKAKAADPDRAAAAFKSSSTAARSSASGSEARDLTDAAEKTLQAAERTAEAADKTAAVAAPATPEEKS